MSELIVFVDDYSSVTVKIEETVVIKEKVCASDDSDENIPLSDFVPDKQGNMVEFYEYETHFIKPELIEGGPSGSSFICDSGSSVGRVKSHVCQECARAFPRKQNLTRHIKGVHKKLKKYSCEECHLAFTQKVHLKVHVDTIHRKSKKFSCEECDRSFTRKDILKEHISAVHRKLKNYSCGECSRAFSQKTNLRVHIAAVHNESKK